MNIIIIIDTWFIDVKFRDAFVIKVNNIIHIYVLILAKFILHYLRISIEPNLFLPVQEKKLYMENDSYCMKLSKIF